MSLSDFVWETRDGEAHEASSSPRALLQHPSVVEHQRLLMLGLGSDVLMSDRVGLESVKDLLAEPLRSGILSISSRKICNHGKTYRYKEWGGYSLCSHGKRKDRCKECGGSSICSHGKQKRLCKECGGSSLCSHGKRKHLCKKCGGSSLCSHGGKRRRQSTAGSGATQQGFPEPMSEPSSEQIFEPIQSVAPRLSVGALQAMLLIATPVEDGGSEAGEVDGGGEAGEGDGGGLCRNTASVPGERFCSFSHPCGFPISFSHSLCPVPCPLSPGSSCFAPHYCSPFLPPFSVPLPPSSSIPTLVHSVYLLASSAHCSHVRLSSPNNPPLSSSIPEYY